MIFMCFHGVSLVFLMVFDVFSVTSSIFFMVSHGFPPGVEAIWPLRRASTLCTARDWRPAPET